MPAKDVEPRHIVPILVDLIKKGSVVLSNRLRLHLHACFSFGMKHDYDPANFSGATFRIADNPIAKIPKQSGAERVGSHYLSMVEVHQFLFDLEQRRDDLVISQSLRNLATLCLHTGGQRPYELANLTWSDVYFDESLIVVPSEIFKAGREHVVPLTASAIKILERQKEISGATRFVFPVKGNPNKAMSTNSFAHAVSRYCLSTDIRKFTPRDLRRTFKTLAGMLGLSKEIRDRVQGHTIAGVSTKHYDRYSYLQECR